MDKSHLFQSFHMHRIW